MDGKEIVTWKLEEVIGRELFDVEHRFEDDEEELVLHFTGGKEISVFRHKTTGQVHVEGD